MEAAISSLGLAWTQESLGRLTSLLGIEIALSPHENLSLIYNDFAVVLGLVYTCLPFMILPLYASLEKTDRSLLEAGLDLGASQIRLFFFYAYSPSNQEGFSQALFLSSFQHLELLQSLPCSEDPITK